MGAGLRAMAKAMESPPDPKARAPDFYPDPRQRSSRPGSYPSGRGGNEAVEAWEKEGDFWSSASW